LADRLAEPAVARRRVLDPAQLHDLRAGHLIRAEGHTLGENGAAAMLDHDCHVMDAGREGAGRPRG
jgi:hypothetical protein